LTFAGGDSAVAEAAESNADSPPSPRFSESIGEPPPQIGVSAKLSPSALPRSEAAAAALRLGFTSKAPDGSTPELSAIALSIERNVTLHTAGLPSCTFTELYSAHTEPGHKCAKSLVGRGMVSSEIIQPDRSPIMVEGTLRAFYVLENHERLILARVTTGPPLPLVYVIPFAIKRGEGAFGTKLVVRRMEQIEGRCFHPHCFSPYSLNGGYDRISKLGLSLRRHFTRHGRPESFVRARCPAPASNATATFPLYRAQLSYLTGGTARGTVAQPCRAAPSPARKQPRADPAARG
jgi:hypothetical protein